ncbi:MAG: hypothetical protein PHQ83_08770 [Eubacteriales bacterium]|nr:hypothetical protein [Eubacteriales bacterium]
MLQADTIIKKNPVPLRPIVLLILGSFFAASLPWVFILAVPAAAGFYLLQPIPLMFITYPAIYSVAGFLVKTWAIRPVWALLLLFLAFALVISQTIAWAATAYFGFYLVFFLIGVGVKGFMAVRRSKAARPE